MVQQTVGNQEVPRRLSQRAHRIAIGVLGISLPLAVYILAGLRETEGLAAWEPLQSVSAYYYTGATGAFVGVLFAMALFLLTYPGYDGFVWDRRLGKVGGAAGLGVALFPTKAPCEACKLAWWRESTGVIHYSSAVALFIVFVLFAMWLFRRSDIPERKNRPLDKRRRDDVCLACGIAILAFLAWAGLAATSGRSILLPESLAIIAFSVSWLVKGEVAQATADVVRGALSPASESDQLG